MKKVVLCLLMLAMLIPFVACANTKDVNKNKKQDEATWADRELDFGGDEITFAYVEGEQGNFTQMSIEVDEDDGDSVTSALYNRNQLIESKYNVDIVAYEAAQGIQNLSETISTALDAGTNDYDVIAGYQYYDIDMAAKGYFYDINKLPEEADYINLEADYWGTDLINAMSYNDHIYWITGDISLRYVSGMYCTFINADLYNNKIASVEGYESIYNVVRNHKWTLDTFAAMNELSYEDRNADEKNNEGDIVGWVTEICDDSEAMAIAAGVQFSTKDDDGAISITLGGERTITFCEKLNKLLKSNKMLEYADNSSKSSMTYFANGEALMVTNKLFQAQVYLSEMENYYVVPLPMLDEQQEDYISFIHDGCTIFGISLYTDVLPAAAATLEAMAQESAKSVISIYYDSALKYKYTRDNDSAEMVDLIHNTITTDFAAAWSTSIKNIAHFFRENTANLGNISNIIKKKTVTWKLALTTLLDSLDEIASYEE